MSGPLSCVYELCRESSVELQFVIILGVISRSSSRAVILMMYLFIIINFAIYLSEANPDLSSPMCCSDTDRVLRSAADFLGFHDHSGGLGETSLSLSFLFCEIGIEQAPAA